MAAAGERPQKPFGPALERRVRRHIERHGLLRPGDRVLAAVSGGGDSTALLLVLSRLRPALGIDLSAAYFDHGLRGGGASRRERDFVAKLAGSTNVELVRGAGDVRSHARERRVSIEEAARELRYHFLAGAALEMGAAAVATGHTADDQAETVLMNILRGAGISGVAGMLPLARWPYPDERTPQLSLVRPLLEVTRAETLAYCREMGVRPLEDVSNRSLAYRRNRIRREVLPFLRRYNPRIDDALRRLAASAAAEREALEEIAAGLLPAVGRFHGRAVRLSRSGLRAQPPGLRVHILRAAGARLIGDVRDIGRPHWEAMAAALDAPTGAELDLPRGLRVRIEYDDLILTLGGQTGPSPLPSEEVFLAVPGRTRVDGWIFDARFVEGEVPPSPAASPSVARFDADAIDLPLGVRRRRRGDRFRPLGMAGEKKLQDVFVDAKVPRVERDSVPIVCDRAGIVWVVGHRIAERARVVDSTRRVLDIGVAFESATNIAGNP
ncbi:MAG: tRNA lysidine(34) synthetase TilS [Dehalococcoidia bacterium]|nr:tRNA lysidine(34) synthetase TilS [Dehalococcoidia bacterium]